MTLSAPRSRSARSRPVKTSPRLYHRDRGRTRVDKPARLDLLAIMRMPSITAALRSSLRSPPSRCATTTSQYPLDRARSVRADTPAQSNADVDPRPWCQCFHAAMRLRVSAWAPYWTPATSIMAASAHPAALSRGPGAAPTATSGRETRDLNHDSDSRERNIEIASFRGSKSQKLAISNAMLAGKSTPA